MLLGTLGHPSFPAEDDFVNREFYFQHFLPVRRSLVQDFGSSFSGISGYAVQAAVQGALGMWGEDQPNAAVQNTNIWAPIDEQIQFN